MSRRPSLFSVTNEMGGKGSAAAAMSAAIFGPAAAASWDQPVIFCCFRKCRGCVFRKELQYTSIASPIGCCHQPAGRSLCRWDRAHETTEDRPGGSLGYGCL